MCPACPRTFWDGSRVYLGKYVSDLLKVQFRVVLFSGCVCFVIICFAFYVFQIFVMIVSMYCDASSQLYYFVRRSRQREGSGGAQPPQLELGGVWGGGAPPIFQIKSEVCYERRSPHGPHELSAN